MNNSLPLKIILILTSFSFMKTYGQDLEKHQWTNRVLIVRTVDTESNKYQEQVKEFTSSTEELIDRKLILYKINKDDFTLTNYQNSALNYSGKVSKKLAEGILNEKDNFEIILIGLDGGIKLQQTEVLTKQELFNTIDAMPMRRNEIKNR